MSLRKNVVEFAIENKDKLKWSEIAEHFGLEPNQKEIKKLSDYMRYYKATGNLVPPSLEEEIITNEIEFEESKPVVIPSIPGFKVKSAHIGVTGVPTFTYSTEEEVIIKPTLDLDFLKECLKKEIKPIHTNKSVEGKTLMLFIGDSHIGMSIDNEAMLSSKTIGFEDMLLSLTNLIDQPFKEVVVIYGGDMTDSVANKTSRGGHYLPSQMTDREMFESFISGSKTFFNTLVSHEYVGKVSFYSVGEDNHTGSMAGIFSRALEIWLNVQYPDIETKIFTQFIESIEKDGHIFIFTHGKDAKEMFKNLPLILDPKTESYLMSWCLSKNIVPNYKTTHVIKFDLHQSSFQLGRFFSYLNCLSSQIGSKWQQHNFMNSCPGVSYSIISSNGILNGEYLF